MNNRGMEATAGAADSGRRLVDSAQDVAARAGAVMQKGLGRAGERAQDLAEDANQRVVRLTGRPIESWTGDMRRYVQEHPLQAVAITVAIGYVLGKLLSRD